MSGKKLLKIEKVIASNIKKARIYSNSTQQDVAKALGITYQQVQKYESGANRISAGNLLLISMFFKTPIAFFYDIPDIPSDTLEDTEVIDREAAKLLHIFKMIKSTSLRKKVIKLCAALKDDPV